LKNKLIYKENRWQWEVTYAKFMPHIVAYGPRFPGAAVVEHQPNEYIKIEDLILNAKIYAHAIYELSQKDWNL